MIRAQPVLNLGVIRRIPEIGLRIALAFDRLCPESRGM
jgi:hypothetical protein